MSWSESRPRAQPHERCHAPLIDRYFDVRSGLADLEYLLFGDDLALQSRRLFDAGRVQAGDFLGLARLRGEGHHSQDENGCRGCECLSHDNLHTLTLELFTNAPAGILCRRWRLAMLPRHF